METGSDQASRNKVFDLIKDIRVSQLVTLDRAGKLRARPMVAKQETYDGVLWFFTSAGSGKIDEITQHSEVLLNYSDPSSQTYVSVLGDGAVVRDPAKVRELWSEAMRAWFPNGPEDPDIALLKVHVREADFWDSPSSTFVHAYGYAKAVVTGEQPHPGDVKHVEFTPPADPAR